MGSCAILSQLVALSTRAVQPSQTGFHWKKQVTRRLPLIFPCFLLRPISYPTRFLRHEEIRSPSHIIRLPLTAFHTIIDFILSSPEPAPNLPPSSCSFWVLYHRHQKQNRGNTLCNDHHLCTHNSLSCKITTLLIQRQCSILPFL